MSTTAKQIRSKINRAHENIGEFALRAGRFYNANPHIVTSKEDLVRGKRVWYLVQVPAIPHALADVAADAIGNLRKPLDYLATQIEYAACGREPKHRVYFPTGGSLAQYEANRRAYIRCSGQTAMDAFDAAEPYRGGKGEVLWQLHALNTPEKHRSPLTLSGGFRAFDIGAVVRDDWRKNFPGDAGADAIPSIFLRPTDRMCPLKVGAELFAELLDTPVNEERKFLLEISLDVPGVIECAPALETLQKFADAVSGVVTDFEPLLP